MQQANDEFDELVTNVTTFRELFYKFWKSMIHQWEMWLKVIQEIKDINNILLRYQWHIILKISMTYWHVSVTKNKLKNIKEQKIIIRIEK